MWHNLKTWLRKCHKPDNSPVLWELSVHFTRFYLPWWGGVLGLRKFISPFHRVQMMQPQNYKSHIVVLLFCVTLLCCSVTKLCLTLLWSQGLKPSRLLCPWQEYWSRLLFPSPGYLPNPGIEPSLLHWQVDSLPLSHQGSPRNIGTVVNWNHLSPYCVNPKTKEIWSAGGYRLHLFKTFRPPISSKLGCREIQNKMVK